MTWSALSRSLREVRVHLCQTSQGSAGAREFIKNMYATIKLDNPGFPFLIREAEGTPAKIIGRYDFGVESAVDLEGKPAADVETALKKLINATKAPGK